MGVLEFLISWGRDLAESSGYMGLFITQTLESALIPIPSEVVVPLGGFMASVGKLNLGLVIFWVTVGNFVGCMASYILGYQGGRPLLERYGKYLLISKNEIDHMDTLFAKHGSLVAFVSRLLPGVRTFSSLIIGSGKLAIEKFMIYTILGSLIWNGILAYIGYALGSRWETFGPIYRKFEIVILGAVLIFIIVFVAKRINTIRNENRSS